jgi:hypothetical protein
VSPRITKKQLLLDFFQAGGNRPLALADLRSARDELRRVLGPDDKTSFSYMTSLLRESGYEVRYEDRFSDPVVPEPYATRLKGVLEFHDFTSAEQSLARIGAIHSEYSSAADRRGVAFVQAIVKKGKLRARSLAANPRVHVAKRQEKEEIARWFQVWLETPELFADWLELRKRSEEFQTLFGISAGDEP